MRAVGGLAGLVAVLAAVPASAQQAAGAPGPGWRAAVSAALAFGHAEGRAAALAGHSVPAQRMKVYAALDQLDGLASSARDAYVRVKQYGSPWWTIAADVRIGDMFACQAEKILDMALPQMATQGLPPQARAQYLEVFDGLLAPLRQEARALWERAAVSEEVSPFWSGRAWERLKGAAPPGC